MPPDMDYHCRYVADWVAIKQRSGLEMSELETDAVEDITAVCP